MATLQDNPSLVPDAVQEWTRELNISELGRVGFLNINLTLWNESSTSVPNVIEGSIIEINNSMYVETTNVALNITGQQVNVINWVIYEVSGSLATAYLKPTAPTASDYDVDKGGFYDGSGYRWTGQYIFVSPAGTAYSNKGILDYANGAMLKYRIDDEADDFLIDANLDVKETLTVNGSSHFKDFIDCDGAINVDGAAFLNSGVNIGNTLSLFGILEPRSSTTEGFWTGTQIIPRGVYSVFFADTNGNIQMYVTSTGQWEKIADGENFGTLIFSDGINFRNVGTVAHYRKF